ncbi:MAG: hypothetical protein WKG01_21670 [Kofleriaceae bacterium]
MVYSPSTATASWVERELFAVGTIIQIARSIPKLVGQLTDDTQQTRPQVLVIDLEGLSAGELMNLHEIRELGWFGTMIALGTVPPELRSSLQIDRVIETPLTQTGALTEAITKHRREMYARTIQLPTLASLDDL